MPWTSQPPADTPLDLSSPICKGLIRSYRLQHDAREDVIGADATLVNGTSNSVTSRGLAKGFNGTSDYIQLPTADMVSAYPIAVSYWVNQTNTQTVHISLHGTAYHLTIGVFAGNAIMLSNAGTGNNYYGYNLPGDWFSIPWHHIAHSATGSLPTCNLFVDGLPIPLVYIGQQWGDPAAGNHSIGGRVNGASLQPLAGNISDVLIYNRILGAQDAKWLYANSWLAYQA